MVCGWSTWLFRTLFIGKKSPTAIEPLSIQSGTLVFDTGGAWYDNQVMVAWANFLLITLKMVDCGMDIPFVALISSLSIGSDVVVEIRGENALKLVVDGNVSIASDLSLNGNSGQQGIYSGQGGPGGWASGRGLRNTDLFANLHPALNGQGPGGGRGYEIGKSTGGGSYGGVGSGGLSGGVPGLIYGEDLITDLVGGSGGGHAIAGSGNAGGGGAISILAQGSFRLEANASITANGGVGTSHYDGSGAGGSGGAIRIEASSINNLGKIEAKGGNATGDASLAGAGGGGRIALLSNGAIFDGDTNASGNKLISGAYGLSFSRSGGTLDT